MNFALPDLRGRLPLHQGNGFVLGETGGAEAITLTTEQMPQHSHAALAAAAAVTSDPGGKDLGEVGRLPYREEAPSVAMHPAALGVSGGSQPHTNLQPYLAVSFIISLFGIYSQT